MADLNAALTKLVEVATEITERLYQTASDNSKPAIELVLATYRYGAIFGIVIAGFLLPIAYFTFSRIGKWISVKGEYCGEYRLMYIPYLFALTGFLVYEVDTLLDPWNWIAAIEPKIYLVHEIMRSIHK